MRKLALALAIFLGALFMDGAPISYRVTGYKLYKTGSAGQVKRAPANLPIEVFYDDETREVQVIADESLGTGTVTLSDQKQIH